MFQMVITSSGIFRFSNVSVTCKLKDVLKKNYLRDNRCFFTKTPSTDTVNPAMDTTVVNNDISSPVELKIPVPWGHIAAKQWGSQNGKPVLGVHGWQDNAGTFDRLAPLLPKDWNFVSVDLPGHGLSSHYPNGFVYHLWDYVAAIQEIISFLQWDKFNYLGHSMGGAIGFAYSSLFPENIINFVSIDLVKPITVDAANPRLHKELVKFFKERARFQKEFGRPAPELFLDDAVNIIREKQEGSLTAESVKILMKRGGENLPNGKMRFVRDRRLVLPMIGLSSTSTEQMKNLIHFMTCNLLVIKAKRGPMYEKAEVYEEFKRIYARNCKLFNYIEVEGTHHVHLNNPENVVDYIIKFIK